MLAVGKKINFSLTPSERYNLYSGKRKNDEDALVKNQSRKFMGKEQERRK